MKTQLLIDNQRYAVEVWTMEPIDGFFRFGVQAWSRENVFPYVIRLSEEFVEDELDNEKKQDYLEKIAIKVAEAHLKDIMKMNPNSVIADLSYWFREAKRQLDSE